MNNNFEINIEWYDREDEPIDVNNFTACYMTIKLYNKCITHNIDQFNNQPKDYIITSAYPFAIWLAANYFRLLWEKENNTHDYAMSHSMVSSGYGFLWPNCSFIKKNNFIHATMGEPHPAFTNDPTTGISVLILFKEDFIETIEDFIDKTISRLLEFNIDHNDDLLSLWYQIKEDKKDPHQMLYNIFEAKLGYDYTQGNEYRITNNDLYQELIKHYNNGVPTNTKKYIINDDDFILTEKNIEEEVIEQILTAIKNKIEEIDNTIGLVYPEMENMPEAIEKVKELMKKHANNFDISHNKVEK